MKLFSAIAMAVAASLLSGCDFHGKIEATVAQTPKTFCNPLNLDYRFMVIEGGDGIREAADPVVVSYKGKYFLFASKSSGYWHSTDFVNWTHVIIPGTVLPIEDYAPAIFVHNDYIYYVGSTGGQGTLYRSNNPEAGTWEKVKEIWSFWDPAFYVEGDNLYLYYGSSPTDPIRGQVLDLNTLEAKSEVIACLDSDREQHGWERPGEHNEELQRPYIEGAWMTEHNGKYYLQYAGPGTQWKSYADGVYVGDSPMGPFRYMENNPVSYRPDGFMAGAGHGCMFQAGDQWWKAATNSISVRHWFERRLSFYPSGFDADGYLFTDTYLGDYPMFLPGSKEASEGQRPDWMLLSYRKPVAVSSALPDYPAENAVDEESRTAWVAASNGEEWMQIDLAQSSSIAAIQLNYDEYGATQRGINPAICQSYVIEASHDGEQWYTVVDNTDKRTDRPHDYIEFEKPFNARYIKWTNKKYTVSDNVSLRELRIFGHGKGKAPRPVEGLVVRRDMADACKALLLWDAPKDAKSYVVRYGIAPDKLYTSYQVLEGTSLEIGSLNKGVTYYFTVDAYNENGISHGTKLIELKP